MRKVGEFIFADEWELS